ncbi:MAG: translocation/assembly module TamB [Bacteroidetes bacterium]|nr:translocation/assembly module TamB [Bacteroidota bacterium]
MLSLLLLVVLVYFLLQTTPVQNYLARQAANRLSSALKTEVKVSHIDLAFFNTLELKGTLVRDQQKDTLLYAGTLKVNITDWFFFKDKAELKYIGLENTLVHLHRRDSVWNYQFLIDYFSGPSTGKSNNPIELSVKNVDFKNIRVLQEDEWRGENMGLTLSSLALETETFDLHQKNIHIKSLVLYQPVFSIYNYTGYRPPRVFASNDSIPPNDPAHLRWNPGNWNLRINNLVINNGSFRNDVKTDRAPYYYFDGAHFQWSKINARFSELAFVNDTLKANIDLSTVERSGFNVKLLKANLRFYPEAMEFKQLDIRTNRSHLRNAFAMRYKTFDDMSDFIEKVVLDGQFTDAVIHSSDIAYFAPELANWDKVINITGKAKGTISDLKGDNVKVTAGQNTFLNGDFRLTGLPDIEKTYIDFTANDFRTTYADAVRFLPGIADLTELDLPKLEFLKFKGSFTGFIRDFVTYGSIETALGTLATDVNMKIPVKGIPTYQGRLSTEDFQLGNFVKNNQLGHVAFEGDVTGKGFTMNNNLDATLKGNIPFIEYNDYHYKDIVVDGRLAKKKFNGNVVVNDEHLEATLRGLVDFSGKVPLFDFEALVNTANLHSLHFTRDEVDFNGNFNVNFSGNTIDNFIGTARISDASVFKNGQKISFDSLYVESSVQDKGYKTINVQSNEFDAVLAGEFNISSLPDAFQTFLNRYYPSYIAASKKKVYNNFSFSIVTRKVDDYLDLLDKRFKGFNYTTLNGRVNTRENIFDLDAEVPQFSYKNLAFSDIKFEGRGTYDSLVVKSTVGDIFVNDSLHFPGTQLSVVAGNDMSKVNIRTSANQTLNSANISGRVQTLKDGVRVLFDPSHFDINNKQWTIDKGGELILSRELVTSDGVRIFSADQEILLSSVPSSVGKGNDLKIDLKKINIGDFTPFFVKSNRFEGLLTGSIDVVDPFGNLQVEAEARAEQFRMDNDSIGAVALNSSYNNNTGKVQFKANAVNPNYNFDIAGLVNTKDSLSDAIDITTNLKDTKIDLLQQYLTSIFSKIEGKASGQLRIVGDPSSLKYLGDLTLQDGGLRVAYTKVYYKIPTAKVSFTDGLIDFGQLQIQDTLGNKGQILEGKLYHNNFKDMMFDFHIQSNRLLLLNTTAADNDLFYGNVIGRADMTFNGPQHDMAMNIRGEPTDSSKVFIATKTSRESADADFIVWKQYGKEMVDIRPYDQESNLTVSLDITANNKATVYMIIDEMTGDIIQARGNGNLKMKVGTNENFTMNGRYEIESGYYNFNFQAGRKTFKLMPDRNNYISWTGDPYEAVLKIDALYEADNVRFSDLLSSGGFSVVDDNVRKFRGTVYVIANITDKLSSPKIGFQIELPENSAIKNNFGAQSLIELIQRDENELYKQVSYLILFNQFGPLTAAGSTTNNGSAIANAAFEGIVVSSISGFLSSVLSNQFTKLFQGIFKDKNLKVDLNASLYSGTNLSGVSNSQVLLPDRTNIGFIVSKSYLNERLTFVVGSAIDFGITATQTSTFQFLPDVSAEYKLTPDGKFRLTFFYRNSWSYLVSSNLQRTGSSLSYRREFDRLGDVFRRKRKQQPARQVERTEAVLGKEGDD